jgi:hypothetical protein
MNDLDWNDYFDNDREAGGAEYTDNEFFETHNDEEA